MSHEINEKVKRVLDKVHQGQTKFQIRHFVLGDQAHLMHQIRQAVMEIEVRADSLATTRFEIEKLKLKKQIKIEKLDKQRESLTETEIKLKELEISQDDWKIESAKKGLKGNENELGYLYGFFEELTEGVDLEDMMSRFDELDEAYWVKRMAKQASIDMATAGGITAGNLAAIELMPGGLQSEVLKETVRLFHESANKIQQQIQARHEDHVQAQQKLDYDLKE